MLASLYNQRRNKGSKEPTPGLIRTVTTGDCIKIDSAEFDNLRVDETFTSPATLFTASPAPVNRNETGGSFAKDDYLMTYNQF